MKPLAILALLLTGCGPSLVLPDPAPDRAQLLIELVGVPRDGAPGPATETVQGEYSAEQRSLEQGRAFERVNYGAIEDVIVMLSGPVTEPRNLDTLRVGRQGFDRTQLLLSRGGVLEVVNDRRLPVTLIGAGFELTVPANTTGRVSEPPAGISDIYAEEDPEWHALLVVHDGPCWIGRSDRPAFFDGLEPGERTVQVFAPRLPVWQQRVDLAAGARRVLRAELTVNTLPRTR